ncbi:MAG TPA: PmeII family type II restriction endonuclease [Pyrinomonadaceae bacterium]|nr:PmeII family type II restriction endonuclease [Pyrinomonadaceae bacterium]
MTSDERYRDYYDFLARNVVTPFYYERLMYLRCCMSLSDVLARKNPYLLKAKNIASPDELVRSIVDAFLSSQEETMFGNKLEAFAVYVSGRLHRGFKSELPSVDLEFERDDVYYIVGIKSGVNWGNSDQVNRMKDNFKAARSFLRGRGETREVVAVNGCIYGKDGKPFKENTDPEKSYYKYAGQDFWDFVSGDGDLYREIIKPIDEESRARDEEFKRTYDGKVNGMVKEFSNIFLDDEGLINWVKLVDYVSRRGKTDVVFPGERRSDECAEYFKKKDDERKRLKEEKRKKEELKKQMGG